MAQRIQRLLLKHENLNLDPQHPRQKASMVVHALGGRDRKIPGAC